MVIDACAEQTILFADKKEACPHRTGRGENDVSCEGVIYICLHDLPFWLRQVIEATGGKWSPRGRSVLKAVRV